MYKASLHSFADNMVTDGCVKKKLLIILGACVVLPSAYTQVKSEFATTLHTSGLLHICFKSG